MSETGIENPLLASRPAWLVGLGVATDEVSTIIDFFENLPDTPGAAFVIVLAQSCEWDTSLLEHLQQQTSMPVQVIREEMLVTVNRLYILPANHILGLDKGHFRLQPLTVATAQLPIDRFFQALARSMGERGIAILLAGTEPDGIEGIQAIIQAGGIALRQFTEPRRFTQILPLEMAAGSVADILSPQELAAVVSDLLQLTAAAPVTAVTDQSGIDPDSLHRILNLLLEREQVDFSHYKFGTLSRRILHRCALTRSLNLEAYLQLLESSLEEQMALRQDLLIGATRFFRDLPLWEILATQVLPQLIAGLQPQQPLRMWIPACATGEEAYTIGMLVDEAITTSGRTIAVKIFATDLDTHALQVASRGIYPDTITQDVSAERLERYFSQQTGQFQVRPSLREMLIFAPHDLTRNAGFSGMHLVSCRNVLIYMQPELQQQVLRLLHFALLPQGFLLLGSSETLGEISHEFLTFDQAWKLYCKRRDVVLLNSPLAREPIAVTLPPPKPFKFGQRHLDRWVNSAFQFCFNNRPLTCLLVSRSNQLLHVFYNAADLLTIPLGEARLDVMDVVIPALQLPLSTALHRAKREQQSVLYTDIKIMQADVPKTVTMRVGFGGSNPNDADCLVVVLEIETAPSVLSESGTFEVASATVQQIAELEYELQQTHENLQVAIEELETTNEEQQATNEELLAANEELQSTNEEMQSVNEELYTVNAEYHAKIQELTQLTNDIDNLLRSTEIGVVFLDAQLNLRKFTPAATQVINLRPTDEGRPLAHFTHNLDCPDLIETLQQAIARGQVLEREVTILPSGNQLLMQVHPYLQDDGSQDGGVITFVNINELKQTQAELNIANTILENLFTDSPVGLGLLDQEGCYLRLNQTLADLGGYAITEHLGNPLSLILPEIAPQILPVMRQVIATGEPIRNQEVQGRTRAHPMADRHWIVSYFPVQLPDDHCGLGLVVTDITEVKRTQAALLESRNFIERIAEFSPVIISIFDLAMQSILYANRALTDLLGYRLPEIEAMAIPQLLTLIHPEDQAGIQRFIQEQLLPAMDGQVLTWDYRIRHRSGYYRWFQSRCIVFSRAASGELLQILAISTDISDRKQLETVLLSEVHHRVRNNLQVITSLLSMQSRQQTDSSVLTGLREAQNRIHAMALVHNQLYQSSSFAQINLESYLRQLIQTLFQSYGVNQESVRFTIEASEITLNLNQAIPCALIVNELISHLLQAASEQNRSSDLVIRFQVQSDPRLAVATAITSQSILLTIQDNTDGIIPDRAELSTTLMSMTVVQQLVEQLDGILTFGQQAGISFSISFPLEG